jgi:spore germination protein GerM
MRRRIVAGLAGLAGLALLGGCGVSADGSPQAIASTDLPPGLLEVNPSSSTTLPESPATTTVGVYLLEEAADGVRLVSVDREVTDADVPNERLSTLFLGPSETEMDAGITSAIPTDTVLLDVSTDEDANEVTIDISNDIFTIEGEALAQAFGQIVWTATEPDAGGYRTVRFFVDGEPTTVLDGEGAEKDGPVVRADYTNLSPRRT